MGNNKEHVFNDPVETGPEESPMACRRAGVLIETSLSNVARDSEREQLESHLAECETCRDYYSDATLLGSVFSGIRVRFPKAPEPAVRTRRGYLIRWAPLAAAAAVILVAGVCLLLAGNRLGDSGTPAIAPSGGAVAECLGVGIAVGRKAMPAAPAAGNGGVRVERVPVAGLLVIEVMPGSWADRAGLRPGDRIMEASGVRLTGAGGRWALDYMLRNLPDDGKIPLVILRDGRVIRLEYRAGER